MPYRFCRTPLALALHSILLGSALLVPMLTTPIAQAESRHYDLPAGPLEDSLNRFAQAAGLALTFDPAVVQGKQAPALRGELGSPGEGLQRLLQGSGLQALQHANGSYSLVPAISAQGAVELGATSINSTVETLNATSEGTGTYAAQATTIFKGAKTLREIPQSVSVITRQQMDDQGFTDVEDVFTQLPGARIDGYTGTMRVISRGFQTSVQIDGVPEQQEYGGTSFKLDPAIYDRVEMLRGPTGLVTGTGEPGGTINLVRKRPKDTFSLSGNTSYGSWNDARTDLDITGPLNQTGSLRGRTVAVLQDRDHFYDVAFAKRALIYGVLEYDLTQRDIVGLSATRMEDINNTFWGLPQYSDGRLPGRSAFVGSTDRNTRVSTTDVTLDYRHHFESDWQSKATYSYRKDDKALAGLYALEPINLDTGLTTALGINREDTTTYNSFDLNASGPFTLFEKTHQATFGYNKTRQFYKIPLRTNRVYSDADIINNHDWGVSSRDLATLGYAQDIEQSGVYGSISLRILDPLLLTTGGRLSDYKYKSRNTYTSPWITSNAKANNEFTPYLGLTYDISKQLSIYSSYTEIFVPQSAQDYTGSSLKPRTGEQYELGVKGTFLDERLNASLAVYQMNDENRAVNDTDPTHICPQTANQFCSRAAGKIQTRGIEAEISGTPWPGLNISGSYTFTRSKYLSDSDPNNIGKTQTSYLNPKHLFKIWTQYDFRHSGIEQLDDWSLGGGVIIQSSVYSDDAFLSRTYRQGGYAITSAKLGYQVNRNVKISLDADNIFDRTYLKDLGNDYYYNIYGEPRSYRLKISYNFD